MIIESYSKKRYEEFAIEKLLFFVKFDGETEINEQLHCFFSEALENIDLSKSKIGVQVSTERLSKFHIPYRKYAIDAEVCENLLSHFHKVAQSNKCLASVGDQTRIEISVLDLDKLNN